MKQAISASIKALFILMGYPETHRRRNVVCMEKYLAAQCAYEKKQLGVRLNTKVLVMGLMADTKLSMASEIQHWHKKRRSFNIRQVGSLTGQIQDICAVTPWVLSGSVSSWKLHYSQGHLKEVSEVGDMHKSQ
eukprot:2548663-Ditylum_brightwellii.AAC.1